MADETFTIDFVSKTDDMVAGTKKVVASLDDITAALKRANQQGDGLAKRFSNMTPGNELGALGQKRNDLLNRYIEIQQSRDPRRRTKMDAINSAIAVIDGRMGMLSASTGVRPASAPATGASVGYAGGAAGGGMGLGGGVVAGVLGGVVAGLMAGLIHGIGRLVKEVLGWFDEARQLTASAKKEEEAIRKANEWSEGTRENLAIIANLSTAVFGGIKKVLGEIAGQTLNLFLGVSGAIEYLLGTVLSIMGGIPGMKGMGKKLAERGEALMTQSIQTAPKWLGGAGGTGESGVVDGEKVLGKAVATESERKQREMKAARERNEKDYKEDYFRRKEQWQAKEYNDLIKQFMRGGERGGGTTNGMYAVGGEAYVKAYFDEANNIQREALGELKTIARNTQMPLTERDIYENNIRMW